MLSQPKAVVVADVLGHLCKCELDFYSREWDVVHDLKTTAEKGAAPIEFAKTSAEYGYEIQAAFYLDLLDTVGDKKESFAFVVVETDEPYLAGIYTMKHDSPEVDAGRRQYRFLMQSYLDACERYKDMAQWPGYEAYQTLNLPEWALKK